MLYKFLSYKFQIHGGITDKDVTNFVLRAETIAEENKEESSEMDTVVFFDEANTTDSIGLIKEIMCDRRLNGRPISKDLKFIAACNPYRRCWVWVLLQTTECKIHVCIQSVFAQTPFRVLRKSRFTICCMHAKFTRIASRCKS